VMYPEMVDPYGSFLYVRWKLTPLVES
jgi:hypothetical protein